MTEQEGRTVRDRLVGFGMDPERLAAHIERGALLLDGEPVRDADQVTAPGSRLVVTGQKRSVSAA
ncbi:hypothetical protein [Pseudonocardia sp. NPDC049635]|uniref:hypothetical protein n=1 Tax=Pseudonocardia sp. NPDC049635 TaxID=3155506 RepID=UPI003406B93B